MGQELVEKIEGWFANCDCDGEFARPARSVPYWVIPPVHNTGRLIFTTKPRVILAAIDHAGVDVELGVVGRYGLPNVADIPWLTNLSRMHGLLFLGDMDPVDFMVFLWCRESLPSKCITYLGLKDTLLDLLGMRSAESVSIPCTISEQKTLAFLNDVYPGVKEVLGTQCALILDQGRKVELEAILGSKNPAATILRSIAFR